MKPKLVRDRIPDLILQNEKKTPHIYQADDKEYWLKLKEKLLEEVDEFIKSEELIELANLQPLNSIAQTLQIAHKPHTFKTKHKRFKLLLPCRWHKKFQNTLFGINSSVKGKMLIAS